MAETKSKDIEKDDGAEEAKSNTKPLIFMHPLSDTLKKLMESFQDQDHIEIFEVDLLKEAIQLFTTMAPAVVISSDPRKVLQFQAVNKRAIAKTSSKNILLTPKKLSMKAERKFDQLGVSDIIMEPIPPKTLFYKINLLMKSLPKKKTEGEDDYEMKEGMHAEEEEQGDTNLKLKNKGGKEGDLGGYLEGKLSKKEEEEKEKKVNYNKIDDVLSSKKKNNDLKNSEQVEDLGGFMEGKGEGQMEDLAGNFKLDSNGSEEKKKQSELKYNGEAEKKKDQSNLQAKLNNLEDPELADPKGKTNLELDDDMEDPNLFANTQDAPELADPKEKTNLDLEDDMEDPNLFTNTSEAPEKKDPKAKTNLNLEEDIDPKLKAPKALEKPQEERKGKTDLKLEEDIIDPELSMNELTDLPEKEKKKKTDLKLEEDIDDPQLSLSQEQKKKPDFNNKGKGQTDQIDDIGAGTGSTDKLDQKDLAGKGSKEEFKKEDPSKGKFGEQLQQDPLAGKGGRDELDQGPQVGKLTPEQKKKEELKKKQQAIAEKEKKGPEWAKMNEQKQKENNKALNQADDIDKYMRSESAKLEKKEKEPPKDREAALREPEELKKKKADELNVEEDWDFEKGEGPQEFEDFVPEENEGPKYAQKEDLGEQTIDYAAIKKAYAEGTSGDDAFKDIKAGSGEKQPYTFESGEGSKKEHYYKDEDGVVRASDDKKEEQKIYHPDSKGVEHMIKLLDNYRKKKHDFVDTVSSIAQTLYDQKEGFASFYYKKGEALESFFSFHEKISNDKGNPDIFENWTQLLSENREKWSEDKLPHWKDHTFQEETNYYFFPYYEGLNFIGMAVVTFNKSCEESDGPFVETLLETARGIYLNRYHEDGGLIEYSRGPKESSPDKQEEKKSKEGEVKKGLFGKMFKKKAS